MEEKLELKIGDNRWYLNAPLNVVSINIARNFLSEAEQELKKYDKGKKGGKQLMNTSNREIRKLYCPECDGLLELVGTCF